MTGSVINGQASDFWHLVFGVWKFLFAFCLPSFCHASKNKDCTGFEVVRAPSFLALKNNVAGQFLAASARVQS